MQEAEQTKRKVEDFRQTTDALEKELDRAIQTNRELTSDLESKDTQIYARDQHQDEMAEWAK